MHYEIVIVKSFFQTTLTTWNMMLTINRLGKQISTDHVKEHNGLQHQLCHAFKIFSTDVLICYVHAFIFSHMHALTCVRVYVHACARACANSTIMADIYHSSTQLEIIKVNQPISCHQITV